MKKVVFFIFLLVCSISYAGWEFTTVTADGEFTDYHDKSTIKKKGSISKMWVMRDYASEQIFSENETYQSSKIISGFDCKEDTIMNISIVWYSGSLGDGSVVSTYTVKESEREWHPIVPGSVDAASWKIACSKK
jgi:hypothetical protein